MPVLTISGIRKKPDPNTTALGGVATGSINAKDADTGDQGPLHGRGSSLQG